VKVPSGESAVVFVYDPQSFKIGKNISLFTLLFLTGTVIFSRNLPLFKKEKK